MGLIAYFTSRRCKMHCADESRGTRWDGQKNEVITFSQDAKINTAGSTFSGELQTALLIGFAKQKQKSCCVTTQLSLYSNLKEMYTTAFRHKLIHNSTTQSKTSKMAANGGNVPHLRAVITSHTLCTLRWCTVQCTPLHYNNYEFTSHLMIVGLLSTALFKYLKCQDQRISKNCRITFIFCSSWNLWRGAHFLHLACQGDGAHPSPPSVTSLPPI